MSLISRAPRVLCSGLSALAILAVAGGAAVSLGAVAWSGAAFAQEHSGGAGQGGSGSGGQGGGGGHEDGGHEDGGHEGSGGSGGGHEGTGSGGQGQGGEAHGEGGQGGAQGAAGSPPWASEGIPEVELGRLNVARAPDQVFDRAYAEAVAQLPAMAAFYNLSLGQMIDQLETNWDNLALIDSPLQNLSLLRDALDGGIDLSAYGISNDRDTLMAVFLGVATDKAVQVTTETVQALSIIMEMPLSPAEASDLAAQAESIRRAVVLGHG